MRIIKNKNENDYYDGYMNHDRKDRFNKVWVRKEKEVLISEARLKSLERACIRVGRNGWDAGYLILAGRVIPFVVRGKRRHGIMCYEYFYTAVTAYHSYKKQKDTGHRSSYWSWNQYGMKAKMENFFRSYRSRSDLCVQQETPIILIQPNMNGYKEFGSIVRRCYVDVNLKDMGLSKIWNAPEMYQMLDVFVSNVLVNDDMVMKPISDKVKVQIHGFDDKYGFRTRPKGSK